MDTTFKTVLSSRRHTIIGDEPLEADGSDLGMSPFDLLLSSLAACKVMTLRWYAMRKKWPLEGVEAVLEMESTKNKEGAATKVKCSLDIRGNLSPEQRQKLVEISEKCPVQKALNGTFDVTSKMVDA